MIEIQFAMLITGLLCFLLGLFAGAIINERKSNNVWCDGCAQQGVSEYYLDENNERQWRWKSLTNNPPPN